MLDDRERTKGAQYPNKNKNQSQNSKHDTTYKKRLPGTRTSPSKLFCRDAEEHNRATKDNPLDDRDRFMLAVSQISGKRLTYAELTGKVGETAV